MAEPQAFSSRECGKKVRVRVSKTTTVTSNLVYTSELASFYASSRSTDAPVHATYLLTGEVAPVKSSGSYRNDDEYEMDMEDDMQESIATRKILLVGEDDLEGELTLVFL